MLSTSTDLTPEQLTIASCLRNPDVIPLVRSKVDPQDFTHPRDEYVFAAILELHKSRAPVEPFTVTDVAIQKGAMGLKRADLIAWMGQVSSGHSATYYAEEVRQAATTRRLKALTPRFQKENNDAQAQASDAMQRRMHGLEEIRDSTISSGLLAKALAEILATPGSPEDWIMPNVLEKGDRLIVTGQEGM